MIREAHEGTFFEKIRVFRSLCKDHHWLIPTMVFNFLASLLAIAGFWLQPNRESFSVGLFICWFCVLICLPYMGHKRSGFEVYQAPLISLGFGILCSLLGAGIFYSVSALKDLLLW